MALADFLRDAFGLAASAVDQEQLCRVFRGELQRGGPPGPAGPEQQYLRAAQRQSQAPAQRARDRLSVSVEAVRASFTRNLRKLPQWPPGATPIPALEENAVHRTPAFGGFA